MNESNDPSAKNHRKSVGKNNGSRFSFVQLFKVMKRLVGLLDKQ